MEDGCPGGTKDLLDAAARPAGQKQAGNPKHKCKNSHSVYFPTEQSKVAGFRRYRTASHAVRKGSTTTFDTLLRSSPSQGFGVTRKAMEAGLSPPRGNIFASDFIRFIKQFGVDYADEEENTRSPPSITTFG
jgi:hypothetical protein